MLNLLNLIKPEGYLLNYLEPETKSAVNTSIKKVQDKTSETSKVTNSKKSTVLNSSSQDSKRLNTLQKKTCPSIVNTDKGIVIKVIKF